MGSGHGGWQDGRLGFTPSPGNPKKTGARKTPTRQRFKTPVTAKGNSPHDWAGQFCFRGIGPNGGLGVRFVKKAQSGESWRFCSGRPSWRTGPRGQSTRGSPEEKTLIRRGFACPEVIPTGGGGQLELATRIRGTDGRWSAGKSSAVLIQAGGEQLSNGVRANDGIDEVGWAGRLSQPAGWPHRLGPLFTAGEPWRGGLTPRQCARGGLAGRTRVGGTSANRRPRSARPTRKGSRWTIYRTTTPNASHRLLARPFAEAKI